MAGLKQLVENSNVVQVIENALHGRKSTRRVVLGAGGETLAAVVTVNAVANPNTAQAQEPTPTVADKEKSVQVAYGFKLSPGLAEVRFRDFETVTHTAEHQVNTIGKGTEAFMAEIGGNFTLDFQESTREDLKGQVQLLATWNSGSYSTVGEHHLDAPERGWAFVHSGANEMTIRIGDEKIEYPKDGHVILVVRGKYGSFGQDTDQNSRLKIDVTEPSAGNVYYQKLMGPEKNIAFVTQKWLANEVAKAHFASPNTGADGRSNVYVVYHDVNTQYTSISRNELKREDTLKGQLERVMDGSTWEQGFSNATV